MKSFCWRQKISYLVLLLRGAPPLCAICSLPAADGGGMIVLAYKIQLLLV